MAPYRTYAIATRIRSGALPDALYWDTLDSYHYVRVQPGDRQTDFVIVGEADHKTGEANDAGVRFEALEAWTRNLIPKLDEVSHRSTPSTMPLSSTVIRFMNASMFIPAIPAKA